MIRFLGSRRWLQFSLRSLLLFTLLAALACSWFTPFTRDERSPEGTLQARYRVRRDWNGALVAAGEQWEFYDNGRPERRWRQHSGPPGGECDGQTCTHWEADGSHSSFAEGDYGHLIWLITHTITGESWNVDEVVIGYPSESEWQVIVARRQ